MIDIEISCLVLHRHINKGGYFFKSSFSMMKVFELDIPSERGLTNFDLISYIEQLKVPYFRGVFMRDELPNRKHIIECGIMNLNIKYTNTEIRKYRNT